MSKERRVGPSAFYKAMDNATDHVQSRKHGDVDKVKRAILKAQGNAKPTKWGNTAKVVLNKEDWSAILKLLAIGET